MTSPLIPVILCGGTGTRLWPLSRASYPKQYWPLGGNGDDTLLQQTQQRLEGIEALGAPLLICNDDHRFIVAEQMRQIGIEPAPSAGAHGRNTAPRSPWPPCRPQPAERSAAAGWPPTMDPEMVQLRAAIDAGGALRAPGDLGIVPTAPETGYGYIEAAEPLEAGPHASADRP